MADILKGYVVEFVGLLNEMSPYLLFGFFIAGLLHVVMPTQKVVKYLGGKNIRSIVNASILGIPLPLCSCGVIPTALSFYKNGASKGATISFLISTPQTGADSIMVTYSLLGLPFALIRPIVALVTGIFGGIFTNRLHNNEVEVPLTVTNDTVSRSNPVITIFKYAFVDFIQDIAKWLVIGIVIAALIAVFIPDGFFNAYLGFPILSMFVVLLISGPLYICATGSVAIAAVLIMKGLSPGAALVFLMAGPATNASTVTMVGKVLGKKALIGYLGSVIAGSFIFGFIIDYFLPLQWFTNVICHDHNHHAMLPAWLQISSSILLGILLLNAFRLKYFNKKKQPVADLTNRNIAMEIKTIQVEGMTCNHCKANVEKGIMGVEGVKDVNIDLQQGKVTISADTIDLNKIKDTVEGLGYTYGGEV